MERKLKKKKNKCFRGSKCGKLKVRLCMGAPSFQSWKEPYKEAELGLRNNLLGNDIDN